MDRPLEVQICEDLLELQGYSATKFELAEYKGNSEIHIHIRRTDPPCCSVCHRELPIYDTRIRHILHASVLCRPVVLVLSLRRTNCPKCGVITEHQSIADGIKRHSRNLEKMTLKYSEKLDNYSIAKLLGFSQSTVYRIDKAGLETLELWLRGNVPKPSHVSIDEVAHKKRHQYTTVLTNQEDAKVIDVSLGTTPISLVTPSSLEAMTSTIHYITVSQPSLPASIAAPRIHWGCSYRPMILRETGESGITA